MRNTGPSRSTFLILCSLLHIRTAVLASALVLGYPMWTEDTDFFGCGVATWTTDRVELFRANVTS